MSIKLTDLPLIQSVENKPVKFRGGTNSGDYNGFQETAYFDITNLYNVINEMNISLQDMSMAHSIDSAYTQMRVGDLPSIIEQLRSELDGYRYDKHRKAIIYPSKTSNIYGSNDGADINLDYSQINIPYHSSTSKLFLYDDAIDLITIPSTLIHEVTPTENGSTIVDTDFNKCITGYENEYFIRRVESDSTDPIEMTVEILLPDNIISNRDVNTIYLSPYPYAALDILSMEYQADAEWKPVPGFTSHKLYKETPVKDATSDVKVGYIENAENIKLCFDRIQMNKVRIKFRQSKYVVEGGKNIFYLGLKYFSVNFEMVKRQFCTFISDVDFKTSRNKTIYNITPKLNNNAILSDGSDEKKTLFSFEVYAVNEVGEKRYIKNTLPFTFSDSRLMIITNMYYDSVNDINPSLYRLEVEYDVEGDGSSGGGDTGGGSSDCKCILSNMVFNDDDIIIGADETSKPYKLSAVAMLDGDCEIPGHIEKNINYTYTIKQYGAGARISGDTLVVNSTGVVVITATAKIGTATISKDATITVEKIKKYTLTYLSTNGGTLNGKKIQNIEHGQDAEPVEAIADTGYHLVQWSDGNTDAIRTDTFITSSAIHTAQFEINRYTVTYMDSLGNTITTEEVKHGFPATPPTAPEVVDYLFTGWDVSLDSITGDIVATAQYRIKTFMVTFIDWDDRIIDTQEIIIHNDAIKPQDPSREGHTFSRWSHDTDAVTQDITARAEYDINTFVVTFLNWDGSLLEEQTVDWMTDAVPPTALKEGWHFLDWDNSYRAVTEDRTLIAQFAINVYSVRFVDHNDNTVEIVNVEHGSDATAPAPPDRTGYDFVGWDTNFTNVTSNMTVKTIYEIKKFTVTIDKTGEGTFSPNTTIVEYGQSLTINYTPAISHNFKQVTSNGKVVSSTSTSCTLSSITEDKNVVVEFEIKTFVITWTTYNGSVIRRDTVNYGTSIADIVTPDHPDREGYYPGGWKVTPTSVDIWNITSDFTMIAAYEIKRFTITPSTDGNGSISPSTPQTIDYGSNQSFTMTPNTGYHVSEVLENGVKVAGNVTSYRVSSIKEDKTIRVNHELNTYTVKWVGEGSTVYKTETVQHGSNGTPPADPTRTGYEFRGWNRTANNIVSDVTITAIWARIFIFRFGTSTSSVTSCDAIYPYTVPSKYLITIAGSTTYSDKLDVTGATITVADPSILTVDRRDQADGLLYLVGKKDGTTTVTVTRDGITRTLTVNMKYLTVNTSTENITILEGKIIDVPLMDFMNSSGGRELSYGATKDNTVCSGMNLMTSESDISTAYRIIGGHAIQSGTCNMTISLTDAVGKTYSKRFNYTVEKNTKAKILNASGSSEVRSITVKADGSTTVDIVFGINDNGTWYYSNSQPWNTSVTSTAQAVRHSTHCMTDDRPSYNIATLEFPINRPNGFDSSIVRVVGVKKGRCLLRLYNNTAGMYELSPKYFYVIVNVV